MSKAFDFKLNLAGLDEIMKSPAMQSHLDAAGSVVSSIAGGDYGVRVHVADYTAIANVWPNTQRAAKDNLAGEFVDWIVGSQHRPEINKLVQTGKKDDTLFWIFMQENHKKMRVTNISPHLVDHVDWLIGGSMINQWRENIVRSCRWNDENLIIELSDKLASRK